MTMKSGGKSLHLLLGAVLAALLLSALLPVDALAAEMQEKTIPSPVRVGYFDLGGYYAVQPDGTVDSYDAAFLNEIARNTDLAFAYVDCGTWNQALEMLEAHEIDLLGTMQWTAQREARYEICNASYGYIVAELAALPDSRLIYEDYAGMNHASVGYIGGYVIEKQLQDLMEREKLTFNLVTYPNQTALDRALEHGEIDLVALNAHAAHEEWKVIEKFAYAPFYFATWKGNAALTDEISEEIVRINIHQPSFVGNLTNEFFHQMVVSPYSKSEYDVIWKEKTYTVYFDEAAAPLVWYDSASSEMDGVLVKICRQLEELTGLHFAIRPHTEDAEQQGDTTVLYRTLRYDTGRTAEEEPGVTEAILDQNFELYHRVGSDYALSDAYRIAIVGNRGGLLPYLKDTYPNSSVTEYATPEACMAALTDGEADLTFLNVNVAEQLVITKNLDQIAAIPESSARFGIALQFFGEDAQVLSSIVNKGIGLLDESLISMAMVDYALETAPNVTLGYLVKQHLGATVLLAFLLTLIFIGCAVLFTYARVMRRQSKRVAQANQARTDFFARMSHDLRTPMNGILGMIQLTQQANTMEEVRANMDKAKSSGDYMLSLINDTLDLQRLENGRLQFNLQQVQVGSFIHNVIDMLQISAQQKKITLTLDMQGVQEDGYVTVDPIRVKQIFVNILSNAVKFTPEGGSIAAQIVHLGQDGNMAHCQISIRDTGIGMSKAFVQEKLFQPYTQEKNAVTGQYAGSGLGLAITKNLVQMMGGSIAVESEQGKGTTVTVCLDFECAARETVQQNRRQLHEKQLEMESKLAGRHVLICEDHPLNAEITQRLLRKVDCTSDLAENGQIGVERFTASAPGTYDAILMDIRMPVMDGLAATRAIRGSDHPDAQRIPILAMTANAYDEDVEKSKAAGMNAHLAKPINPEIFYGVLSEKIQCFRKGTATI